MPLPPELKPATKSRVMDLVQRAGIDVSDWPNYENGASNPGANPKYCYEWALKEPGKVVVCNLWSSGMKEVAGRIEQHLVLSDTATHKEIDPTRRARRKRMAALLAEAAAEALPVRVIVLDGKSRSASADGKTHVRYRALDPASWSVVKAEPSSGKFVLSRGEAPQKFVDQFDLPRPHTGPGTTSTATVTVRSRSREVRMFTLQRAKGKCEYCGAMGFSFADGRVYLETHHIVPLANGGPDIPDNVAALCANHHREAHHGRNARTIKLRLQETLRGDAYPSLNRTF